MRDDAGGGDHWALCGIRLTRLPLERLADLCVAGREAGAVPVTVACANLHCVATGAQDAEFARALAATSHVTADGAPLVAAGRLLGGPVGERITGYDLFEAVMERLDRRGGARVFFLGSTPPVLERIVRRAGRDYPRIAVHVLSPPFGPLPETDAARIRSAIDAVRPDVVWVGMSAPKQEKWMAANASLVDAGAIACVGAVFDYYAGTLERAPAWLRRVGGEWLFRLVQEPRRVWRRYFVSGPAFAGLVWRDWRARRRLRADPAR